MDPYYSDASVTILHGEALSTMQTMASESVDLVVTSPPYNMGLSPGGNGRGMYPHTTQKASRFTTDGYAGAGDDAMAAEEYAALRCAELWEMWRLARKAVFWNHRPRIIHGELVDPLDLFRAAGLEIPPVRQRIILARPTGIDVNVSHFVTRGEYLYLFAKTSSPVVDHAASGMGDVWPTPIVTGSDHPAPFHESVPDRCIRATAAQSVLDPFVGSGTTLAVAKQRGIIGLGIDLSAEFCAMAAARVGSTEHTVGHAGTLWGTP